MCATSFPKLCFLVLFLYLDATVSGSLVTDKSFILRPEEQQYNLPIFPSKIPFGSSGFSTSTAVMIRFGRHQCLATATATGICRHRTTELLEDGASVLTEIKSSPPQLEATKTFEDEELFTWHQMVQTPTPTIVSSETTSEVETRSVLADPRIIHSLMTTIIH